MSLGEIGRMRGDLIGDHAGLDVVAVRQAEMLFRRDVAEHGRAVPANLRRADRRGDVIVSRRDIRRKRTERVERRLAAPFELFLHVLLDEMHGHVARPFIHDLDAVVPGDARQFALRLELGELRFVVGISDRTWTQAVAERERHVVLAHDLADLRGSACR